MAESTVEAIKDIEFDLSIQMTSASQRHHRKAGTYNKTMMIFAPNRRKFTRKLTLIATLTLIFSASSAGGPGRVWELVRVSYQNDFILHPPNLIAKKKSYQPNGGHCRTCCMSGLNDSSSVIQDLIHFREIVL